MDRKTVDSAGTVIFKDKKVLLIHYAGRYGFPKGHLEVGETKEETALRETKEETGLLVELLSRDPLVVPSAKNGDCRSVHFFPAKVVGGEVKPQKGEVDEVCWVSYEEALSLLSFPQDKKVLQHFLEKIHL